MTQNPEDLSILLQSQFYSNRIIYIMINSGLIFNINFKEEKIFGIVA